MSLKTVHLAFIIAATLLAGFLAEWCVQRYLASPDAALLAGGVASAFAALGLIWYAMRFLQKFRHVRFY